MHAQTILKKMLLSISGRVILSDPARNITYQWAWNHIKKLPLQSSIIDIGSRDSLFPAFLIWRRYYVRIIERDARFSERQVINHQHWRVQPVINTCDFLTINIYREFDIICSLFSLQHAGENDIPAYQKAAQVLRCGGLFLSATEYRDRGTYFQTGRDDGSMRIYGPEEINNRIVQPLHDEGMVECDRVYVHVSPKFKIATRVTDKRKSSIILLLFKKM